MNAPPPIARTTVPVVLGPTASGKSGLALDLAAAMDGTVVNADSQQLYRDLRILTARPAPADESRVPHRLYGVLDAAEVASAARWRDMALTEMRAARAAGRVPILCGGTGFYIRAMLDGLSPMPEIPDDVRRAVRESLAAEGAPALHARLTAVDPETAGRLAPGDGQRIARALEVVEASGTPLSAWQRRPADGPPADFAFRVITLLPPRDVTAARTDARLDDMIAAGALEEVRALMDRGVPADAPAMKAVGVRELAAHLRGEATLESALADAKTATRRYAKRQRTWLRHQILSDMRFDEQYSKRTSRKIFSFIREFGLTG